jgi:hypothetical protein
MAGEHHREAAGTLRRKTRTVVRDGRFDTIQGLVIPGTTTYVEAKSKWQLSPTAGVSSRS